MDHRTLEARARDEDARPRGAGGRGRMLLLVATTLLVAGTGACRTRPAAESSGTSVTPRQQLYGRLPQDRPEQAFTFEGVEGSLLSFTLRSDDGSLAAPDVQMMDPEGKPVDVRPHIASPDGAATVRASGIVLLRSGAYQVTVRPHTPGCDVWYSFEHCLEFPPVLGERATLSSCSPYPLTFSAPRGAMVTVKIAPLPGSSVVPRVEGVKDPWGGRALDPSRRPGGAPPAQITEGHDGTLYLNFPAPIPGRYTVLAGAVPGREGAALMTATIRAPATPAAVVWHPNRTPDAYGVPAASGSASDPGR